MKEDLMSTFDITLENALGFSKKSKDITIDDLLNRLDKISIISDGNIEYPYKDMKRENKIVQLLVIIDNYVQKETQ
jgi:hypothetical protein|tara:strand:- start:1913 stop:2140 length:228 start_codon:yes stop_codon:yes gene_type:complete